MDRLGKNQNLYYSYHFSEIINHSMMQVSLNRGLEKFKEKLEKSVSKELIQIHPKITFRPLMAGDLSNK